MASLASLAMRSDCLLVLSRGVPRPRRRGGPGADPGGGQAARDAHLRRQPGRAWLLEPSPSDGQWTGLDVDFCRALAAAIFNDASKVQFEALSATDRFEALQSKKIDVLSRNSTWTLSRETELGLAFAGVNFYDGQGLMVRRARNVRPRSISTAARSASRPERRPS